MKLKYQTKIYIMQLQIDKLGKVAVTVEEDYWSMQKDYDRLTIVEKEGIFGTK